MKKLFLVILLNLLNADSRSQTFHFDFESGMQNWVADFADYPDGDSLTYQLNWLHTALPAAIIPAQNGIFMEGNNYSDDLFFFIKTQISGLVPNALYMASFAIDIATNENIFQIGGSDLILKAGATVTEPMKFTNSTGMVRMNINKGNQAAPGSDMDTLGLVRHPFNDTLYHVFTLHNINHPFPVTTDGSGNLWLIIGAESMFESYAKIYFAGVHADFNFVSGIQPEDEVKKSVIWPNPSKGRVQFALPGMQIKELKIFNTHMQWMRTLPFSEKVDLTDLTNGIYFLEVKEKGINQYFKLIICK